MTMDEAYDKLVVAGLPKFSIEYSVSHADYNTVFDGSMRLDRYSVYANDKLHTERLDGSLKAAVALAIAHHQEFHNQSIERAAEETRFYESFGV